MTVELTGFVIDAADPVAVAAFWRSALGGEHADDGCWRARDRGYVSRSAVPTADRAQDRQEPRPLRHLCRCGRAAPRVGGQPCWPNTRRSGPPWRIPEGNEFCAFVEPCLRRTGPGFRRVHRQRPTRGARAVVGRRTRCPAWGRARTARRAGCTGPQVRRSSSGSSSASMTRGSARTGGNGGSGERPWLTEPLQGDGATLRATNSAWPDSAGPEKTKLPGTSVPGSFGEYKEAYQPRLPHTGHAPMPWLCHNVLRNTDLLRAAGGVRRTGAAVGTPGADIELQTAVVAVAGVDRPVAAGLAGRDRVPVHAARIRGSGGQGHRSGDQRRHRSQPYRSSCGGSSTSFLSKRARQSSAHRSGRSCRLMEAARVLGACHLGQARQGRHRSPRRSDIARRLEDPEGLSVQSHSHAGS